MNPNIQQLLQMSQQVQTRLSQLQTELGQRTVTCSSGGGMVTATADGRGKIRSLKIDPSVVTGGDVEMLEDLVLAAVSEAQNRAQQLYEDEMRKLSGGFNLPFSLPGIGRKTALRLAFHLLKAPSDDAQRLARAIVAVRERVRPCEVCGNLTEASPCAICTSTRRDATLVCVVEEASDIMAIERTGEYRGMYHVLGGRLSPLDGIGPSELNVEPLMRRVGGGDVQEVVLATNPSVEGEATAMYLRKLIGPLGVRVTRIARGLPIGGDLEYADGVTIAEALSARREM
jgi:recombination protein RecR